MSLVRELTSNPARDIVEGRLKLPTVRTAPLRERKLKPRPVCPTGAEESPAANPAACRATVERMKQLGLVTVAPSAELSSLDLLRIKRGALIGAPASEAAAAGAGQRQFLRPALLEFGKARRGSFTAGEAADWLVTHGRPFVSSLRFQIITVLRLLRAQGLVEIVGQKKQRGRGHPEYLWQFTSSSGGKANGHVYCNQTQPAVPAATQTAAAGNNLPPIHILTANGQAPQPAVKGLVAGHLSNPARRGHSHRAQSLTLADAILRNQIVNQKP